MTYEVKQWRDWEEQRIEFLTSKNLADNVVNSVHQIMSCQIERDDCIGNPFTPSDHLACLFVTLHLLSYLELVAHMNP